MAKILEINPVNPQPRLIAQVVEVLQRGGVIGYPTDTMYGIGCDIFNQKAVKRVYQIKRRPKDKPFSFMCASLTNISAYGHVGNSAAVFPLQRLGHEVAVARCEQVEGDERGGRLGRQSADT